MIRPGLQPDSGSGKLPSESHQVFGFDVGCGEIRGVEGPGTVDPRCSQAGRVGTMNIPWVHGDEQQPVDSLTGFPGGVVIGFADRFPPGSVLNTEEPRKFVPDAAPAKEGFRHRC